MHIVFYLFMYTTHVNVSSLVTLFLNNVQVLFICTDLAAELLGLNHTIIRRSFEFLDVVMEKA